MNNFFGKEESVFSIFTSIATVVLAILSLILTMQYGKNQSELVELRKITKSMSLLAQKNDIEDRKRDISIKLLSKQFNELESISNSTNKSLNILVEDQIKKNRIEIEQAKPILFLDIDGRVNIFPKNKAQKNTT